MLSIRQFFETGERGALFQVMVDKLGLRGAILSRANSEKVMKRAQDRCADCDREDSCIAWMAGNAEPAEAPYFCRNHDMFERLKHDIESERALQNA